MTILTTPLQELPEKLKRADQNIDRLNSEINLFIQSGKYPVLPDPNAEEWKFPLQCWRPESSELPVTRPEPQMKCDQDYGKAENE